MIYTYIINMTASFCDNMGLELSKLNNTHITNTVTAYNWKHGMNLSTMRNTHITNTVTTCNNIFGIYFYQT